MTAWTEHLKKYASDNNMTYKEAMKDEKSKTLYNKTKPEKPVKEKLVKEKPVLTKEKTQPTVKPVKKVRKRHPKAPPAEVEE